MKRSLSIFLNEKFNLSNLHFDSVNKLSKAIIKELQKKKDYEIELFLRKTSIESNFFLKKSINLFHYIDYFFKKSHSEKIISVSEAEVTLGFFLSKGDKFIILHGAEFFTHKHLRAKSRYKIKEIFGRFLIRLFKSRVKKFFVVSSWALDHWKKGLGLKDEKIEVIGNPIERDFFQINTKAKEKNIVFLGNDKLQKNFTRAKQAFQVFSDSNPDYKLIVIGKKIFNEDPISKIEYLGIIDDDKLKQMLSKSEILLFPSLVESFGLPVIEGLMSSMKVVCSDRGSLPEISEGEAFLVNPYKVSSIADGLLQASKSEFKTDVNKFSKYSSENYTSRLLEKIYD